MTFQNFKLSNQILNASYTNTNLMEFGEELGLLKSNLVIKSFCACTSFTKKATKTKRSSLNNFISNI